MDILFDQKTEDLKLVGGDLVIVKDIRDELTQRLYLRVKTFKREWFLDLSYGIDYLNDVFGVGISQNKVDAIINQTIGADPYVKTIVNFKSKIEGYKYSCKFSVKSVEMKSAINYYILVNENKVILTDQYNNQLVTRI